MTRFRFDLLPLLLEKFFGVCFLQEHGSWRREGVLCVGLVAPSTLWRKSWLSDSNEQRYVVGSCFVFGIYDTLWTSCNGSPSSEKAFDGTYYVY
jgi:hypothetical protein